MRRLNALLAAALLILLAWHGLAGSFMLLGVNAGTGKIAGCPPDPFFSSKKSYGTFFAIPLRRAL